MATTGQWSLNAQALGEPSSTTSQVVNFRARSGRQDVVVLPRLVASGVPVRLHVAAFRALLAGVVVERWTLVSGSLGEVDDPK